MQSRVSRRSLPRLPLSGHHYDSQSRRRNEPATAAGPSCASLARAIASMSVDSALDPMIAGPEGGPSSDMQRYEPLHHEAVELFEDAARKLRERFRSSVSEALRGFARRLFEREWREVANLESVDSIPPLALAYLTSCERCVYDVLNKNHEGAASAHFEECVSEAANNIRRKVIASWSYEGDVLRIRGKRTA